MDKFLCLDVETGGIGTDKSLLTAYFMVLDSNFKKISDLSLKVKPDNGIYQVTAQALSINKINLIEHEAEAIEEREAGTRLYEFLRIASSDGKSKLIPVGQNVKFDIDFVWAKLLTRSTWEHFVSYRVMDTATIGQFLRFSGLLPMGNSGSLGSLAEAFEVTNPGPHTSEGDVLTTVGVLKGMMRLIRR